MSDSFTLGVVTSPPSDLIPIPSELSELIAIVSNGVGGGGGGGVRAETVWTDNTGAYFVRVDNGNAISWTTISGSASSAPGTGARPISAPLPSATGASSAVTIGTSSSLVSAAAARTSILSLKNESTTATIACSLGGTAAINAAGSYTLPPGQSIKWEMPGFVPGDALNCIASAASTPATLTSR